SLNTARCAEAVADPNLLATDLADYLVNHGLPFRKAHEAVGRAVARCAELKCELNELPLAEYQAISELYGADIHDVLQVQRSMEARKAVGAPSPGNVAAELSRWKALLSRE
ncbi:MAG: argininosuccinate lyase, partial [Chthoniobacteraceae bacterium]|nr:argininosuccinate lyase [Chthoniobacteraceae bacterium]